MSFEVFSSCIKSKQEKPFSSMIETLVNLHIWFLLLM